MLIYDNLSTKKLELGHIVILGQVATNKRSKSLCGLFLSGPPISGSIRIKKYQLYAFIQFYGGHSLKHIPRIYLSILKDTPVPFQLFVDLEKLYGGDMSNIDLWVGGLLETTVNGPGEVFTAIIKDQFLRIRNGDRFWFENYRQNK